MTMGRVRGGCGIAVACLQLVFVLCIPISRVACFNAPNQIRPRTNRITLSLQLLRRDRHHAAAGDDEVVSFVSTAAATASLIATLSLTLAAPMAVAQQQPLPLQIYPAAVLTRRHVEPAAPPALHPRLVALEGSFKQSAAGVIVASSSTVEEESSASDLTSSAPFSDGLSATPSTSTDEISSVEDATSSITKGIFANVEMPSFGPQGTTRTAELQESLDQIQQQRDKQSQRIQALAEQNAKLQQQSIQRTEASRNVGQEKREAAMRKVMAAKEAKEQENELQREKNAENYRRYRESVGESASGPSFQFDFPKVPQMDNKLGSAFEYASKAWERENKYMREQQGRVN